MGLFDFLYNIKIPLFVIVSLVVLFLEILFLMVQIKNKKRKKYDDQNNRIMLELYRDKYEKKIYELEKEMSYNIDRWKDTNHLLISSVKNDINENVLKQTILNNNFLKSSGINIDDLKVDKNFIFVLTPYNEIYDDVYMAIKNVCSDIGMNCSRGDDEYIKSDILSHTLKQIIRASIVIANIDGRSPNVFYELGIAHTLDKNTILISKSLNDAPFDIKSKRIILYKNIKQLKIMLTSELNKVFENITGST